MAQKTKASKPKPRRDIVVTVNMPRTMIERIEKYGEKFFPGAQSRAPVIRQLIESALADSEE